MPAFGSIKRRDLIRALKQAGFDGPHTSGKHEFLVKGNLRLALPKSASGGDQQGFTFEYTRASGNFAGEMGEVIRKSS